MKFSNALSLYNGPLGKPLQALLHALMSAYVTKQEPYYSAIHEILTTIIKEKSALDGLDVTTRFALRTMLKPLLKQGEKK